MTIQALETLRIEGATVGILEVPLDDFFQLSRIAPPFEIVNSMCWRGYLGTWEIVDDRLYLVELSGELENARKADLGTLFPGFPGRVFAHWYSGPLTIQRANRLESVRRQPDADDATELVMELESGVVVSKTLRRNEAGGSRP